MYGNYKAIIYRNFTLSDKIKYISSDTLWRTNFFWVAFCNVDNVEEGKEVPTIKQHQLLFNIPNFQLWEVMVSASQYFGRSKWCICISVII